ncbi:MAG: MarR family transcriptional regulator, partial [Methanothrix sp.]|uniref:helix-turn-helix transcriptional regulator n=1 Tax=Methanothrix sp. TaxID=90426 RepID=UPI003BB1B840
MGERSGFAAKSSIAALQERALGIIASQPGGIYQSDLRRILGIDSSKCSKVVSRLQSSELIRRESVPASSTYLLKISNALVSSTVTAPSQTTA